MSFETKTVRRGAQLTLNKWRNRSNSNLKSSQVKYHEAYDAHLQDTAEAWVEFAQNITKAITTGQTVTRDDVPSKLIDREYSSDGTVVLRTFRGGGEPNTRSTSHDEDQMDQLLAFLHLYPNEKLSMADLKAAELDKIYAKIDWALLALDYDKQAGDGSQVFGK